MGGTIAKRYNNIRDYAYMFGQFCSVLNIRMILVLI